MFIAAASVSRARLFSRSSCSTTPVNSWPRASRCRAPMSTAPLILSSTAVVLCSRVPFVTSAAFAATGSVGYALLYPIIVPAVCFVLALMLMPETRQVSIWQPIEPKAG